MGASCPHVSPVKPPFPRLCHSLSRQYLFSVSERPRIVTGLDLKAREALLAWVPCSVTVKAAADPPCTRALLGQRREWVEDGSGNPQVAGPFLLEGYFHVRN